MTEILAVIADRRNMGEIRRARGGRLSFVYDDRWRSRDSAFPLSLSMPLAVAGHGHAAVEPWLWGLLPDNEHILARWAQRFHVSPSNAFALLGAVGEDCAGAVQLVRPERVEEIRNESGDVEWQTESDVADRLRFLKRDQAAWRMPYDAGQFSLAGAQPKIALFHDGLRWGVPRGSMPTTHILKPSIQGLEGHAENEHICLALARALGLPAARSELLMFEDEAAIVVVRFDRRWHDGSARRVHQEDMCQVLGIHPAKKYQNEGGPGCGRICEAIRAYSGEPGEDAWTFTRALMLNWIIAGTDAHAKNFSMLIGSGGHARLAPLYDVTSALPYYSYPGKLKLATKIGGEYRLGMVFARHWSRCAAELGLAPLKVLDMGKDMLERLPAAIAGIADNAKDSGLDHPIIDQLAAALTSRSEDCSRSLKILQDRTEF